jgi:hypothetical protein
MVFSIKVAADFADLENIDRVFQLVREFQQQTKYASWREDVLQIKLVLCMFSVNFIFFLFFTRMCVVGAALTICLSQCSLGIL